MSERTDLWDRELDMATRIAMSTPESERDAVVARLRVQIGTASPLYRRGRTRRARLWNWALDTEYTAVGPPPIAWIGVSAALVAVVVGFFVVPL